VKARSHWETTADGARHELGIVEVNGHEFAACGSTIDASAGVLVGYVHVGADGVATLTTWDGQHICPLYKSGESRGWCRSRITCWRATFAGKRWHGRNAGASMLLRMRTGR